MKKILKNQNNLANTLSKLGTVKKLFSSLTSIHLKSELEKQHTKNILAHMYEKDGLEILHPWSTETDDDGNANV